MPLQVLVAVLEHTPQSADLVKMQEELVSSKGLRCFVIILHISWLLRCKGCVLLCAPT